MKPKSALDLLELIGDRMKKNYEDISRAYLMRRTPVILRLDGRAFHSLLAKAKKPYDEDFAGSMLEAVGYLAEEIQGFKCAYVQSDEVNILITDYDALQTQGWFDYNLSKMVSISAAVMSLRFNYSYETENAVFDCRAFNIPREEVVNCFLWRMLDWQRNSIEMFARAHFSHSQLHGKSQVDMHEMLHGIGKNWTTDVPLRFRNGTWLIGDIVRSDILPKYENINSVLNPLINCDSREAIND